MHANGQMNAHTPTPRRKFKTNDPQLTVEGQLKAGEHTDLIVFTIPLAFFEIVCIVNIPPEGETTAPVYCKFKVQRPNSGFQSRGSQESRPGFTVEGEDGE